MPATVFCPYSEQEGDSVAAVMIGVDPHKGSHTAVVVGAAEEQLGRLRVRASAEQAQQLVAWAAAWPERTWAVEGARAWGTCFKRRISDGIFRHLRADAAAAAAQLAGPGGQPGNDTDVSAAGLHPEHQLFGKATPGPEPTLRPASRTQPGKPSSRASKKMSRTP
jgi:hypothetical protein